MKLLQAGPSPFARKVRVLVREAGREGEVEIAQVTASPTAPDPTLIAANPLGKLPALVREDGPTIYDSRVICRYLDARFDAGLYPEPRLWEVLTLEATADGIMDAAILMVYEARLREEAMRSEAWVEGQWARIARAADAAEDLWAGHLAGPLHMGQIALGCALGYLDFRMPERAWREGRPGLAAWFERFAARPSMAATAPDLPA